MEDYPFLTCPDECLWGNPIRLHTPYWLWKMYVHVCDGYGVIANTLDNNQGCWLLSRLFLIRRSEPHQEVRTSLGGQEVRILIVIKVLTSWWGQTSGKLHFVQQTVSYYTVCTTGKKSRQFILCLSNILIIELPLYWPSLSLFIILCSTQCNNFPSNFYVQVVPSGIRKDYSCSWHWEKVCSCLEGENGEVVPGYREEYFSQDTEGC